MRSVVRWLLRKEVVGAFAGVAAIGGLCAVTILPAALRRRDDRRARRTMSDIRQIGTALDAYFLAEGRYPSSPDAAAANRLLESRKGYEAWNASIPWPTRSALRMEALRTALSPYISALPIRDAWGRPYRYVTSKDGRHYTIASFGPDGKLGNGFVGVRGFFEKSYDLTYSDGAFMEWMEGT